VNVRVLINGEPRELGSDATVASVVRSVHGEHDARGIAVALDGEVVPRATWELTALSEGARVEIVVAVQGG
jgi:sulfur carrier protein